MKIKDIRILPLTQEIPEGGWTPGSLPGDNVHPQTQFALCQGPAPSRAVARKLAPRVAGWYFWLLFVGEKRRRE